MWPWIVHEIVPIAMTIIAALGGLVVARINKLARDVHTVNDQVSNVNAQVTNHHDDAPNMRVQIDTLERKLDLLNGLVIRAIDTSSSIERFTKRAIDDIGQRLDAIEDERSPPRAAPAGTQ